MSSRTTPAMTAVTSLRTASGSGAAPVRSANSRCEAPSRVGASVPTYAVVAGQAWHWVDPVAGAARAARTLRSDGRLAVFWNAFQTPPDLAEAFAAVYGRVMPDSPLLRGGAGTSGPDAYRGLCAKAADGMRQTGAFGQPEQWYFEWERPYTRDEWLEQVPTFDGFSRIPADRQQEILAGIGTAIDAAGGGFTMGFTTLAVTAALASSAAGPPE